MIRLAAVTDSVSVSPDNAHLDYGDSLQLCASVSLSRNYNISSGNYSLENATYACSWSLNCANGNSVSTSGLFTAGTDDGTCEVSDCISITVIKNPGNL